MKDSRDLLPTPPEAATAPTVRKAPSDSSERLHFRLTGPSRTIDRRTHAARRDIADLALAGFVFAPHYAAAVPHGVTAPRVPVRAQPLLSATAVSELLHGEGFAVIDMSGDWAWGYCMHDQYVGYVPADALGPVVEASHIVTADAALVFAEADIKAPVVARLPLGSRVGGAVEGNFLAIAGGFIALRHLTPLDAPLADPVAMAERLVGTPYLWGGRSSDGLDCSGLVQLTLALTGTPAPRDSDQQRAALGTTLPEDAPLRRGDLIFFPGHVGFMADDTHLVHANAHWMQVTIEPLADVVARLAPTHAQPITARKRIHA